MRALWSEQAKRRAWRRVWVAVAEAQAAAGLVTVEQVEALQARALDINLERAQAIEAQVHHDLIAELKNFAEQVPSAGGILHWGLTAADVQDNAEVVRQKAALAILLDGLRRLLLQFADRIEQTHDLHVMGFTHLQPAEPTTLGYRLSISAQDLSEHFEVLLRLHRHLRGKGIRGPVGTSAPQVDMLDGTEQTLEMFESSVMQSLGIEAFQLSAQTYPRIQDYTLLAALSGLAASMHKFGLDLRLMQSPGFGGTSEPFEDGQLGSSAMPFKRNPILAEKICSLARLLPGQAGVAWENAANAGLERTLDDSANRRIVIPEAFLTCDELLGTGIRIMQGLEIEPDRSFNPLGTYGTFAALERVLTALVKAGADRQAMHQRLRDHSMQAWAHVQKGQTNPLVDAIAQDTGLLEYLQPGRIRELMQVEDYVGLAPQRALEMAERIRDRFQRSEEAGR
jgi:adenylosuccinate lyase